MFIKTFPVGAFQCNCTVLADPETGEAIVIDPGDEASKIINQLSGFKVKYLLHTHAHLDHIGATKQVHDHTKAPICLHKEDLFLYENIEMQSQLIGLPVDPVVRPVSKYLVHGDMLEWGKDCQTKVLHTPGHTPGSLTFHFQKQNQNLVFAGDTLFMGSIGRTDLWGGDSELILESIQTQILALDDKATVICGHGPNTTIGRERKMNPFLQ